MNNSVIRGGMATIALVAVAACSSNAGGGYAPSPAAGGMQAIHAGAQPNHQSGTVQPPSSTQRSLAGAALSVAGSTINLDQFGSSDSRTVRMLRHGRTISHKRIPHAVALTCKHGVEYKYSSTGFNQVNEILEYFYDTDCTMPYDYYALDIDYTSAGGTAESTETMYDRSGNTTSYQSNELSFAADANGKLTNLVVQRTNNQGSNLFSSGFTCLFQTGNAIDCGSGVIASVQTRSSNAMMHPHAVQPTPTPVASAAPGEVGFSQTAVGQYVTQNSDRHSNGWGDGPSGLQIAINGAGFAGDAGALSITADTPPAWLISGGNQVDTLTGTATIGFGGFGHSGDGWHSNARNARKPLCSGAMSSLSLTLTDSANGLTVSLESNSRGELTGSVKQASTGQTVATMTLDFSGSGTVSYTGGATEQVQDWVFIN